MKLLTNRERTDGVSWEDEDGARVGDNREREIEDRN